MAKILGATVVETFKKQGYYAPLVVASKAEMQEMRHRLETYETNSGAVFKTSNRYYKNHLIFKWLAEFIRSPRILDAVEDLIGPNLMVWSTDWWIKEAHSPQFVSWHQDSQYWGLDTQKLITVWVALSPSTEQSGCMRVLPGSHLGRDLPHQETFHSDNMLTRGQQIDDIDETQSVNLELDPGNAAIFSYRIAHASHPNRSDDRRIGLAIRYIPPDDTTGHFTLEPEPAYDFDPAIAEFHEQAVEERRKLLYRGATLSNGHKSQ